MILQTPFPHYGASVATQSVKNVKERIAATVAFNLIGSRIEAEHCTSRGRIDLCVRTDRAVYVIEFKKDRPADEALGQILECRYCEKFAAGPLPVICIGAAFDSRTGSLTEWTMATP